MMAGVYRHYKGELLQVFGIGQHTETDELVVVYVILSDRSGPRLKAMPLKRFNERLVWDDGIVRAQCEFLNDT